MNYKLKRILVNTIRKRQPAYKLSQNAGASPGTLTYTGKAIDEVPEITLYQYNEDDINKVKTQNLSEALDQLNMAQTNWVNISAIHDTKMIQEVGDFFFLHPLVLEDIPNTLLSPQYEGFDDYLFITLKMLSVNPEHHLVEQEHVSFILGQNFLLSFQEGSRDVFDPVRQRLEKSRGKIRKRRADYLLYALIDVIVDNYYAITEEISDKMSQLEAELIYNPGPQSVEKIANYKRQLIELKRTVYPLRNALGSLMKEEDLVEENTMRFFNDIYSHIDHVINTMETQRDILSGFMDLYMSTLSHHMNEVMKTLTIVATIFIPLTFVVGIYGMNFEYMPELRWKWGYPAVMGFMLIASICMYFYMKSRRWF